MDKLNWSSASSSGENVDEIVLGNKLRSEQHRLNYQSLKAEHARYAYGN